MPEGKALVITWVSGFASDGIGRAGFERSGCSSSGSGLYVYGEVTGGADSKSWRISGHESVADSGCTIHPYLNRPGTVGGDSISFHLFGYLIDE